MALELRLEGDILEIKETICGWTGTRISFWYCDIRNWVVSSHGKKGDKPDRPMTDGQIAWVKRHYLPKIGK